MRTSPRVSVVIPAYNHGAYVGAAIQSVLDQTLPHFELIIIDDGSSDNTEEVVLGFSDDRIRYYSQENRGLSATLNRGVGLARGELFGFLPSDDLYEPEKLARQVALMDAHPEVGLVFTYQTLVDAAGAPLRHGHVEAWFNVPYETKEEIFPALFERNFLAAPSVLIRMACFDRVGGFDESLTCAQDYDVWLRTLKYYDIRLLKAPLIRYRWHGANLTYRPTERTESERAIVLLKAYRDLRIEEVFPSLRRSAPSERPSRYAESLENLAARIEQSGLPGLLPIAGIHRAEAQRWRSQQVGVDLRIDEVAREADDRPSRGSSGKVTVLMEVRSLDTGGLEEVVFNLARSLDRERFNVLIVCVERGGHVARRCREQDIPVEVLGEDRQAEYNELLARHTVDLVCAHYSTFGARLAAKMGIPVVSVIHNLYAWLPDDVFSDLKSHDRYVSRYVAVSEGVARYLAGRFNVSSDRLSVIHNGLDVEALAAGERKPPIHSRKDFGLSEDDYLFLHVAAVTEVKGHNTLIRAMKEIVPKYPQIKVLCVGGVLSQEYSDLIKRRVKAWGLDGHVLFTGFVERITDLYWMADAFVLPSIIEGWSLAVGEAMYFGLPLILTRVGGAATLIEKSDVGALIEPSHDDLLHSRPDEVWQYGLEEDPPNAPQLGEAMIDFYQRRAFWKRAAKKGRAKILKSYTLRIAAGHYEDLFFREVLRAKKEKEQEYWQRLEYARSLDQISRRLKETLELIDPMRRRLDEIGTREAEQAQHLADLEVRQEARLETLASTVTQQLVGLEERHEARLVAIRGKVTHQLADLEALASTLTHQLADLEARQQARLDLMSQHILERLSLKARLKARLTRDLRVLDELLGAIVSRVRAQLAGARQAVKAWLPFGVRHRLLSLYYWIYPRARPITHRRSVTSQGSTPSSREEAYRRRVEGIARQRHEMTTVNEGHRAALDQLLAESRCERIAIYPPTLMWGEHLFQRPQQIFRALARKGVLGFYCSTSPFADGFDGFRKVADHLYLCGDIALLRGLDERAEMILWMTRPDHRWYRELFPGALTVYEMIDELEVFPEYCEGMERDHLLALTEADVVVATARKLQERIRPIREDVLFAPNGVCLEDFQLAPHLEGPPSDMERIVRRGKPIIGYYGALAEWFDYDLANECARVCKDYSFVFLGPDYDGSVRRLQKRGNVFWLGPKKYSALKQYLRYFDVATIPFQVNAITESTSPIKLFEYMAGGKPIVTTALPECRHYRSVLIGHSGDAYIWQLRLALRRRHDPEYLQVLQEEAKENTWEARVEAILTPLLADAEPRRRYRIGRQFLRAVRRQNAPNIGQPMYDTWLDFALSTNIRGETAVEIVRRHTSIPGKRALDIGCAYGGFPVAFARAGAEAVGIDLNPGLLKLAAENVHDMKVPVSLHLKDITDWAHLNDLGTFDIITCNDLIEHVEDVPKTLEHVARLLKPGALLYMQIPNGFSVGQVLRDGHYGLFGITLLSRPDANRYFGESGYNDAYGVGYFHRLDEYVDILAAHRIHLQGDEIANSFEFLTERIDQIRATLESIRSGPSRCLEPESLSAATKQALADAVDGYLVQVSCELAAYDATVDEGLRAQQARSIVKRYDIEFWEVIGVKAKD